MANLPLYCTYCTMFSTVGKETKILQKGRNTQVTKAPLTQRVFQAVLERYYKVLSQRVSTSHGVNSACLKASRYR